MSYIKDAHALHSKYLIGSREGIYGTPRAQLYLALQHAALALMSREFGGTTALLHLNESKQCLARYYRLQLPV